MSKARVIITAVVLEGRPQAEVARTYGVSKGWVSKLVARYYAEGDAAFEPRSRRPKTSPGAIPDAIVERIVELRRTLTRRGLDAGPDTIHWHLEHHDQITVSVSTIARTLTRAGLVTPQPKKRPRSSYVRFEADLPNECWQADFTHWHLADSTDIEILTWLDDHSRYALSVTAHQPVTGTVVLRAFQATIAGHGPPASTLTDNGMVFTTRFAGGRGGRNGLETELHRLGIHQKNSRPNHPTTCGKVERFQQTLKRWLGSQPATTTIVELQAQLDAFVAIYNHQRPHRSLPRRATPHTIYTARPKASPTRQDEPHHRVRRDRVDTGGTITLRVAGRLRHIGIGRTHARTHVIVLVDDLHVRVIDAATGELLRDLTIDTSRDYQPTGAPKGPTRTKRNAPNPVEGSERFPSPER